MEIYFDRAMEFAAIYGTVCIIVIMIVAWRIKKKWFKDL